jgi:hypothetical protein
LVQKSGFCFARRGNRAPIVTFEAFECALPTGLLGFEIYEILAEGLKPVRKTTELILHAEVLLATQK